MYIYIYHVHYLQQHPNRHYTARCQQQLQQLHLPLLHHLPSSLTDPPLLAAHLEAAAGTHRHAAVDIHRHRAAVGIHRHRAAAGIHHRAAEGVRRHILLLPRNQAGRRHSPVVPLVMVHFHAHILVAAAASANPRNCGTNLLCIHSCVEAGDLYVTATK